MLIVFDSRTNYQKIDYDGDSFVKGDYSVHTIDVLMKHDTEYDTYTYTGSLQFNRSDGQTSPKLVMTPKKIEYDGKVYNGYTYKMEGDWFTEIAGLLKMSVSISTYNEGGTGASTNKAYANIEINVEDSVVETIPTTITNEEYTALMNVVNSKLSIDDEKVYNMQTVYGNTEVFAQACIEKLNELQRIKIFWGYILDDDGTLDSTIGLVGDKNSSVLVISGKGQIEKYKNGQLKNISISYLNARNIVTMGANVQNGNFENIKLTGTLDALDGTIKIPSPTDDNSLVNKKYVDDFKSQSFKYTDDQILKHTNEILGGVDEKGDTLKELFDMILNNKETIDILNDLAIQTYYDNTKTEIIQTMERSHDYTFDATNISKVTLNVPSELTQGYISGFSIRIGNNVPIIEIINGSQYPLLYTLNGMQRKPKHLVFKNNQTLNGAFMFDGINVYCYLKELKIESEIE